MKESDAKSKFYFSSVSLPEEQVPSPDVSTGGWDFLVLSAGGVRGGCHGVGTLALHTIGGRRNSASRIVLRGTNKLISSCSQIVAFLLLAPTLTIIVGRFYEVRYFYAQSQWTLKRI